MADQGKYGARVYLMSGEKIFLLQTIKRGNAQNAPYTVDGQGEQVGVFIDPSDDKAIADAVRSALAGKLHP